MTLENPRKSLHWFLLIAKKKNVTFPDLPDEVPKADILNMETSSWITSNEDELSLFKAKFHIKLN